MKRFFIFAATVLVGVAATLTAAVTASAQGFGPRPDDGFKSIPRAWKWIAQDEVIFSYDGSFADEDAFAFNAATGEFEYGRTAPEKFADFPVHPDGAENLTYSPDSTMLAFTRDNDLYVINIATSEEKRLTFDGSEVILNGYASWVYYEEIFGRPSRYRAFWWSPDSHKLAFYRFDNSSVPMFPIYSAVGQDGSLRQTRYPKAGEPNPEVRIGTVSVEGLFGDSIEVGSVAGSESGSDAGVESGLEGSAPAIVWADFDYSADGYFGTPFWGDDSRELYITQMPRVQNTLDLYAVTVSDGSKRHVYNEKYDTWVDWIEDMLFTDEGLYMARSFETGWEQIYFLSYDGEVRRLTDGENWRVQLQRVDAVSGDVFFTACRDSRLCSALYKVDSEGNVTVLTDPSFSVASVSFSPDGQYFAASLSNTHTPTKVIVASAEGASGEPASLKEAEGWVAAATVVADMAPDGFNPSDYALPELVWLTTEDGFDLPAQITYPKGFDPAQKYPVHVDIYGGPDTPQVRERWTLPFGESQWWAENGIIEVVADCRAAGHNGRAGTDMVYRDLISWPVRDFIAWADYLKSLPYVDGDKIGVEGFSFGGSMTAALVFTASDSYHFGIAGGGVYDWALYDSHYTERFMDTPQNNPEGYAAARVLNMVKDYPADYQDGRPDGSPEGRFRERSEDAPAPERHEATPNAVPNAVSEESAPVMLRITHGTGDDNVHFQNTLQLIDELQRNGKEFELMIYPDGMHGYRGYQGRHFNNGNHAFWLRHLKGESR